MWASGSLPEWHFHSMPSPCRKSGFPHPRSRALPGTALCGEPPDLFWWNQVHVSLTAARPVDSQAMPSVARSPKFLCVQLSLHPDTTNMKLVARCRESKLKCGAGFPTCQSIHSVEQEYDSVIHLSGSRRKEFSFSAARSGLLGRGHRHFGLPVPPCAA